MDLSTWLWGINPTNSELRPEVYCFRLNLNVSRLVYYSVTRLVVVIKERFISL